MPSKLQYTKLSIFPKISSAEMMTKEIVPPPPLRTADQDGECPDKKVTAGADFALQWNTWPSLLPPLSPTLTLPMPQEMDITDQEEPQAPPSPYPWRWRCHSCLTWYELGCTRRCLECSHYFCSRPANDDSLAGAGRRASKKRNRIRSGACRSQFDYTSWTKWGSWRRTVLAQRQENVSEAQVLGMEAIPGLPSVAGTERWMSRELSKKQRLSDAFATYEFRGRGAGDEEDGWVAVPDSVGKLVGDRKEVLYVRGDHDCSLHCDSPSECIHKKHGAISEKRVQYDGSGEVVVIPKRRSPPGFGRRESEKDNKLDMIKEE